MKKQASRDLAEAEALSGLQLILLGMSILAAAFVLRRGFVLGDRSRNRDISAEVRQKIHDSEQSAASRMRRLEVRLHDYDREVEGRAQTRIAMLNELVLQAEQAADRLAERLEEIRRIETAGDESSQADRTDAA